MFHLRKRACIKKVTLWLFKYSLIMRQLLLICFLLFVKFVSAQTTIQRDAEIERMIKCKTFFISLYKVENKVQRVVCLIFSRSF